LHISRQIYGFALKKRKESILEHEELLGLESVNTVIKTGRPIWLGHAECKDDATSKTKVTKYTECTIEEDLVEW